MNNQQEAIYSEALPMSPEEKHRLADRGGESRVSAKARRIAEGLVRIRMAAEVRIGEVDTIWGTASRSLENPQFFVTHGGRPDPPEGHLRTPAKGGPNLGCYSSKPQDYLSQR